MRNSEHNSEYTTNSQPQNISPKIMKKLAIIFSLLIFCFSVAYSLSQNNKYKLRGVFKTPDSSVIPAMNIYINKNGEKSSSFTDINGEFQIELSPGDYELTVNSEFSETFKAFIKIEENGLNPNFVEFIIEPNVNPCGENCPKILNFIAPKYPAAAMAVRASGEVAVSAKIDKNGKVISAVAISGHTLLRKVSEEAAKNFLFEPSENFNEREVKLTFVFIPYIGETKDIKRFFNPYRLAVLAKTYIIVDSPSY